MNTQAREYRAIFISDVHLGTRGCQADLLLDFLKHNRAETIYLVGDIIDGWRLRKRVLWPQQHNDVVQKLLRKARKGVNIYYLPGNHDEAIREFLDTSFGGVRIVNELVHEAADGRRLLVLHGDKFDAVVRHHKWLALLGTHAYNFSFVVNHWLNVCRRKLGLRYWSLSAYLKKKVKNAVAYIGSFKIAAVTDAHNRGYQGIICGHIHHAEIQNIDGSQYLNCGDWVENCTALVENMDGRFEVIQWADVTSETPGNEVTETKAVTA